MMPAMGEKKPQKFDFVVLGSGIAGMRAAIELAYSGSVLVLSKGEMYESNTEYAQGGIAAALADDDEVVLHLHDTLRAGDGLCREEPVKVLVEEGPVQVQQLIAWGMRFDQNGTKLAFTREGAHSRSRILHAHGDSTGSEILRALMAKAKGLHAIHLQPFGFAVALVVDSGAVTGVTYLDEKTAELHIIPATSVLLATGGLGQVYKETTNPAVATGDGVAIAYRAGAELSDMEFVQFHPTALYVKGTPRFLISEAVRGEGAYLRNAVLERFMPHYHEMAELAPRDVVAHAITVEMQKSRSEFVYLDLTALDPDRVKKRFPKIYTTCLELNIDITTDLVPVRPAAHYAMGGVATDVHGATTLKGLFAAGEVACTGVHGANRLASNSLLEGLVFGARAALAMAGQHQGRPPGTPPAAPPMAQEATLLRCPHSEIEKVVSRVRNLMWEKVGIIRCASELKEAIKCLESTALPPCAHPHREYLEAQNILETARLIARSALAREESRGAQYRTDFPLKDEKGPARHSFLAKGGHVRFA
jgi:L-aspartate oxidase